MITKTFEYSRPATLAEALTLLSSGDKRVLAGGMSLIPIMKLRLAAPDHLVDLGRIAGLNGIEQQDGSVNIGATTTHFEVESSALLHTACPLIAEAARWIGDVQVRNCGTIGGSVAHADPAADYPAALLALDASVILANASGERTLSVADFIEDAFTTKLEPGEIIRAISIPVEVAGVGVSYQKMVNPASGFAMVGVAARIGKQDGKISFARIGVTGLSSKAFRATNVEAALIGTAGSESDIFAAVAAIADNVEANSDIHASASYRKQMARVFAARAIRAAASRAAA